MDDRCGLFCPYDGSRMWTAPAATMKWTCPVCGRKFHLTLNLLNAPVLCIEEPTPKFRPWTAEEVPLLAIVVHKEIKTRAVLTMACPATDNHHCSVVAGDLRVSLLELLERWTTDTGAPCGVEQ